MKDKIEQVKEFWDKNKETIFVVGGIAVGGFIVGKLCGISYNIGYEKGVYKGLCVYDEFMVKNVPEAHKLLEAFVIEHPDGI